MVCEKSATLSIFMSTIPKRKYLRPRLKTLQKESGSFFQILTSGRWDYQTTTTGGGGGNNIIIQRSPEMFRTILDHMEGNETYLDLLTFVQLQKLRVEADFYQLKSLIDQLKSSNASKLKHVDVTEHKPTTQNPMLAAIEEKAKSGDFCSTHDPKLQITKLTSLWLSILHWLLSVLFWRRVILALGRSMLALGWTILALRIVLARSVVLALWWILTLISRVRNCGRISCHCLGQNFSLIFLIDHSLLLSCQVIFLKQCVDIIQCLSGKVVNNL